MLNIAGPWEVLGHANEILGRTAYELEAFGTAAPATPTRHGLMLAGLQPLPEEVPTPPDMVILAGASAQEPVPEDHAPFVTWLERHHAGIRRIVSICTGALLLARAGLLDGRRATTHWLHLPLFRSRYPKVKVVDEGIFVQDGPMWTSAGVTAGIDLALALVEEDHGHAVAMQVAKRMVLFLRRSGNQAQFSEALRRQEKAPPRLREVAGFIVEHIHEAMPVDRIAAEVGMSPRTLSRWCREHLDGSPAEVVRRIRVDEARRLLTETDLPLKEVTVRSGLGDTSTFWRVFTQDLGVTPTEYRQRFAKLS